MNKHLEEHRKAWIDQTLLAIHGIPKKKALENLYDSVLALDLPVKFAEWKDSKEQSWKEWARRAVLEDKYSMKAAYQYWLDNVFKIE